MKYLPKNPNMISLFATTNNPLHKSTEMSQEITGRVLFLLAKVSKKVNGQIYDR